MQTGKDLQAAVVNCLKAVGTFRFSVESATNLNWIVAVSGLTRGSFQSPGDAVKMEGGMAGEGIYG